MTLHPSAAPEATPDSPSDQRAHPSSTATAGRDDTGRPTTASTTRGGTPAETGRHAAPASRGNAAPMTRDALDADLAKAVRRAARIRQAFYVLVLLVALVGQVTGAVQTLGIPVIIAIPAVAALELGGVVVMANADVRRRLGERAIASRLLSAAIAAGAVTFNWIVHPDHLVGGFYAGMSALGYLVWLMHAGNQRRDRLRATGDLPPTPPAYELFAHWLRHPATTSRARSIAKANGLDLYESLTAARATIHRENRDAAIAKVLHHKIRAAVDPTTADIAVHVYDLDEIASRLAATADYNGLTALLAADLVPEQILAATSNQATHHHHRHRRWSRRTSLACTPPAPQPAPPRSAEPAQPTRTTATGAELPQPAPKAERHTPPATPPPLQDEEPTEGEDVTRRQDLPAPDDPPAPGRTSKPGGHQDEAAGERHGADDDPDDDDDPETPTGTAEAVAYWLSRNPDMDLELLANKIGKSLRSVYRYLPPDYPRKPGIARSRARQQPNPPPRFGVVE